MGQQVQQVQEGAEEVQQVQEGGEGAEEVQQVQEAAGGQVGGGGLGVGREVRRELVRGVGEDGVLGGS